MMAHQEWMSNNANNVANLNTDGFGSIQTTIQSSSEGSIEASSSSTQNATDLAKELTEQIPIEKGTEANAKAIKSYDEMIGSLIDLTV